MVLFNSENWFQYYETKITRKILLKIYIEVENVKNSNLL